MEKNPIGGQAVIEGVMMRGPSGLATAVRKPDGEIVVNKKPFVTIASRHPILKKPFLRGFVMLAESLACGIRELSWSAREAGEEGEQLTARDLALTMAFAVFLAVLLFIVIPTYMARFLSGSGFGHFWLNMAEGLLRLAIFLLYVVGISLMKDIRRVFQYHGAEHKTINAYEAGAELTPEKIQGFSTLHPRCGTNFLLIVMVISIVIFAFLGWPSLLWRIVSRVLLMPAVAGISYEIIRFAGNNFQYRLVRLLIMPGLLLQKLTTREPSGEQIEVAVKALEAVLPEAAAEGAAGGEGRGLGFAG
ncbi:MAG: DUF1385 domain-containing protein [Acidaminococcales bacterium]|jgi:uncharacterized protein YqhQ|nr:DUF1385 domain-containing protein [Acidaminococcales bacterium]